MAYQGHTPNNLMNIQRHLKGAMDFQRTKSGNPYFRYKGKDISWNKHDKFVITMRDVHNRRTVIKTDDFWQALEMMR